MPEDLIAVASGARRLEDIALDLMRFIVMTTGYARSPVSTGFQAQPAKVQESADAILELYQRCRGIVEGKNLK